MLSHSRGIPTADREQFRSWTTAIVGADYEVRIQGFRKMGSYFDAVVTEHMRTPQENLISELLTAEVGGFTWGLATASICASVHRWHVRCDCRVSATSPLENPCPKPIG